MLEVVLAVSVLAAVVVMGVLISIGNERQRKAIEQLRDDVRNWALGDLEIKRETASRDVHIIDPLAWLHDTARKATGNALELRAIAKVLDNPDAIVVTASDGGYLMFSPVQPNQVKKLLKAPPRRTKTGPLPSEFRMATRGRTKMQSFELSALTAGIFFDIEADQVWRMVADRPLNSNRLWLYQFPAS